MLIENVVGLLSANKGKNYMKLHYALLELGYKSGAILLDAVNFVPQSRPRVFVIAVRNDIKIPQELQDKQPNWLHNKAASDLGKVLPCWIWWKAEKPPGRNESLNDVIDFSIPYDKNDVLKLIPSNHKEKLDSMKNAVVTGYRRTRQGKQCLELRFDGVAGCLRTPDGGSSKQFLIVKQNGKLNARLISSREAARLMGAPDSFILPEHGNDGYKAMGDAVALPVAKFVGQSFLIKLAEAAYGKQQHLQSIKSISVRNRQKQNLGTQYLGAVMQHLVGAKLSLILPQGQFQIHGASVADTPTERSGDFVINNTIIHCTTAPGEPLIQKCRANISAGCLPVIITIFDRVKTAIDLATDVDLNGRIEVWDIQQFISTNISEHSMFDGTARNTKLADIIEKYNKIIDEVETDPSLRIEFEAK